jgi:hypothetical protein
VALRLVFEATADARLYLVPGEDRLDVARADFCGLKGGLIDQVDGYSRRIKPSPLRPITKLPLVVEMVPQRR